MWRNDIVCCVIIKNTEEAIVFGVENSDEESETFGAKMSLEGFVTLPGSHKRLTNHQI